MAIQTGIIKYLIKQPVLIKLNPDGGEIQINKYETLVEYLRNEVKFWGRYQFGSLSENIQNYNSIFHNVSSVANFQTEAEQKSKIDEIRSQLKNPSLYSSKSNLMNFINMYASDKQYVGLGIYNYYMGKNEEHNTHDYFLGRLLGFFYKDSINIKSIKKGFLTESLSNLLSKYNSALSDVERQYNEKINEVESIILSHKDNTEKWLEETKREMAQFIGDKNKKINDLEALYEEELRLEGPAKYWEQFRNKYKNSALIWIGLCSVVGIAIVLLTLHLLKTMPDQLFTGDQFSIENTIRWTILLALMISTAFYLFRLFMKLGLSSFHLSRDANERLQLTHQYLSLLKDKAIEDKHREIILQSLFSRADTGLLKGDSSPTMPDSVLAQVIRNIKGS